ncbi:hypothetical protein JCM6882_002410 [Rhodosporidiobolus microsporus]
MLLWTVLLGLPLAGLASPSPAGGSSLTKRSSPLVPAVIFSLEKRQSPSADEVDGLLDGWQELLGRAAEVVQPGSDSSCKQTCTPYVVDIATCSSGSTSPEIAYCACESSALDSMMSCANCIGSEEQIWGRGFERVCTEVLLADSSSSSSSSRSTSSTSSDPFNGFGTVSVGDDAVTIATFDPSVNYLTRTSTLDGPRNGGDLPTSGTTSASGSSETGQVNGGDESPSDGAVVLRAEAGAMGAAVAVAAALFAL